MSLFNLSARAFARLWGVDERTVRNWVSKGCPKIGGRGTGTRPTYDETAVLWVYDNIELRDRKRSSREVSDLDVARARKADRHADLLELELMKKRGELVPMETAVSELERICVELRAQIITLPSKWSPQLANLSRRAVQTQLRIVTDELLDCLSTGREVPDRDGNGGTPRKKRSRRSPKKTTHTRKR